MDVNLPGIDGIEATRRLVANGGPVVFLLSTYDEDQIDASGCGAAAYIPKAAFGPSASPTSGATRSAAQPTG